MAALAQLLPDLRLSLNVLRASALLTVLTLAIGPNADLLCAIWCHPVERAALNCLHQETTTPRASRSGDGNQEGAIGAIVFIREDVRRGASLPHSTYDAEAIPGFACVPSVAGSHCNDAPSGGLALEARPLMLPLRI